jgi:hypothetical protein
MAFLGNSVLDGGLDILGTLADRLDICSAEPTTYAEATSTNTLGNETSITIGAPGDRGGGGREVTVSAITAGTVTASGTAAYWSLVDVSETDLLATGSLSSSQGVTSGNSFTLTSFTIGIPDPA